MYCTKRFWLKRPRQRETKDQLLLPSRGQVPLSVLPYFRFLSEEAQRNVMSQLIDNFQTTSISKRGTATSSTAPGATPAPSSASSPEGLAFMRSPMFAKVRKSRLPRLGSGQSEVVWPVDAVKLLQVVRTDEGHIQRYDSLPIHPGLPISITQGIFCRDDLCTAALSEGSFLAHRTTPQSLQKCEENF